VASNFCVKAHVGRSTTDHPVDVNAVHWQFGEDARLANCRAEEGSAALIALLWRMA
jgi:hypothetical protein